MKKVKGNSKIRQSSKGKGRTLLKPPLGVFTSIYLLQVIIIMMMMTQPLSKKSLVHFFPSVPDGRFQALTGSDRWRKTGQLNRGNQRWPCRSMLGYSDSSWVYTRMLDNPFQWILAVLQIHSVSDFLIHSVILIIAINKSTGLIFLKRVCGVLVCLFIPTDVLL